MTNETEKRSIKPLLQESGEYLNQILDIEDFKKFKELTTELKDTWTKKQIFRTETEMRVSVLNDGKFPTKAAKYWQCVREQNVFFENLMQLSFDYRKNDVEIKKLERKLETEKDDLEKELLEIELEQKIYGKANMELVAKDRIREIEQWSVLKKELNDQSFDTKNVNTHQSESLKLILENRKKALSSSSSEAEIINVLGPLQTMNRLSKEGVLLPPSEAIIKLK
jgi:hypothetical protein